MYEGYTLDDFLVWWRLHWRTASDSEVRGRLKAMEKSDPEGLAALHNFGSIVNEKLGETS